MASDMNEILLQSVEVLPSMPDTISKLRKYIEESRNNLEISKVADIISSDPLMTAKLLRLANSPFYGFSREITSLNQVVSLLGIGNIINTIMADSVRDTFKVDVSPYGLNTNDFMNKCSEETAFIADWLNDEDKKLSHFLVPCALILRLGIVIFSNFLIQNKKNAEFLEYLKKIDFRDLSLAENEFLGVDHISFLGFLLYRWNFDEILTETICFIRTPHAARDEVKKSAYALAIIDHLFMPHKTFSLFNVKASIALIEEAKALGVKFNLDNFISKLPKEIREELEKEKK
ncbi:HDOD domain-containing protein [Campylobacter estrildidarum]|uniref:HDOD domain-containing protein n=1 Tax=Campylobacter estrildidarum TaxID=2510189 RepID=A0A4U7BKT1_9BACT|nr:HDOD domain-containing protein [Campylobacter estrildidarum]TKX29144.1 HDOD domain-containing protein [Campylobacter estrildidarum]